ncbi:glutathionylspermidine synthase [Colletotrichum tofieldiae]|uniref:Glutathionylspermidine synthase n=1 Tax=Colletotrichum tofieldiae TaxID=708197 RepID=A0A166NMJ8_9PEZI|nr:glutathionylspermidine synthase [Colletotrichum tofieldiae]GKT63783.1 glutathionylspermidine synthase [Colletotrichum tofieldiae]GKT72213.1 glutathionylspermidine synthase [Colletotrichum tofieldiae]GKT89976.1 glutathionylspermidine synthase [Colletotrichum tofieldiae]
MRRVPVKKRDNATRLVQSQGLVFADLGAHNASEPYWPDDRYYSFALEEITLLENAAKDVFAMCCEAAEYLVEHPDIITKKMAVPAFALKQIKESWDREPAWGSIYGRFDVCFGGLNHPDPRLRVPKFYEFNADTPTTLVEAASIQWLWLEQTGHGNDQFNGITEALVEGWKRNMALIEGALGHKPTVHFAVGEGDSTGEDAMNTMLLMDTCQQAGWSTKALTVEEISLSKKDGRFYDMQGNHIDVIFKLYPWEYMMEQQFAEPCFKDMDNVGKRDEEGNYIGGTIWIEAPYKMLWSNKSLFAILWELFKDDPRSKWLLPTYFDDEVPASLTSFARKPIFAREGVDIVLKENGKVIQDASMGWYGAEGYVVQELALLPEFKDAQAKSHYPVLGLWFVDGEPVGMGIREDGTPVTSNASVFLPHSIEDGPINYRRQKVPTLEEIEQSLRVDEFHDQFDQGVENEMVSYIKKIVI